MTDGITLLFQAGMVGAFIYFALEINKRHAAERKDRDNDWRKFLENGAKQREDAMKASTNGLKELANALTSHDVRAQKRAEAILEEVRNNRK
jgi:phosphohistidine phosphatase SixA